MEKKAYIDDKGKQQWHAVYSTHELLATPQRFVNKTHYKVVADATFRENKAYTVFLNDLVDDDSTEDKRVSLKTIPFGLFGKEYAKTTEAGCRNSQLKAWASHFFPVLYVITSCENTHAYETGYRIMAGLKIANTDDAPVMGPRVRQVHGDFAR